MIHLTNKVGNEMDKGNYACGVLVDFQAAFDTINRYFLLKKQAIMESGEYQLIGLFPTNKP